MIHQLKIKYLAIALVSIYSCVNGATVFSDVNYGGRPFEIRPAYCYNTPFSPKSIILNESNECESFLQADCNGPPTTYIEDTPSIESTQKSFYCV
ncbi:unnamed protein product [Cunninghamella echinulata]